MSLKKTLQEFVSVFGRDGEDLGSVKFNEVTELKNEDLNLFYQYLDFERLLTIGGEFFMNIQSKENIERSQIGWYYIIDKEGNKIADDQNWNKNWVVFGDRNGDAIYYNQSNNSVGGSVNKKIFYRLADSLEDFFDIITAGMKLEEEKYNFETVNDEDEVLPEFIDDVTKILLSKKIEKSVIDDFRSFFFE